MHGGYPTLQKPGDRARAAAAAADSKREQDDEQYPPTHDINVADTVPLASHYPPVPRASPTTASGTTALQLTTLRRSHANVEALAGVKIVGARAGNLRGFLNSQVRFPITQRERDDDDVQVC